MDAWGVMDLLLEREVLAPDQPLSEVPFDVLRENGIKLGRSVPNAEWRELHAAMTSDPDFPAKSARYVSERRP